jgi:2-dehydropantoate 2-reductase
MRHAILGPGGIGGLIGACLANSGNTVTMVVRQESLANYPRKLKLESPFGNIEVEAACAAEVPPCDVLWLTVKATQLDAALPALRNPDFVRAIVPLLNGIDHIPYLRSKYGADRVIPATIAVESERVAPGNFIHRSPFARLNVSSAGKQILEGTLDQLQKIGFECRFIDDEPTLMWGKVVFLAPFALTTTAADKNTGEILSEPAWKAELEACVREACAVAIAENAKVDPESVLATLQAIGKGVMRSSMQKDVEQHKPPELDAIAGPILRGGKRHGIAVPVTEKLVAAVQERAPGRMKD